jgi:Transposase DDE domain
VTSDSKLTGRQIVGWYAKRWAIETWHRDMKQNYGFIDCKCARFSAIEAHVNLSLTAFLLVKEKSTKQKTVADVVKLRELKAIAIELTKFGGIKKVKTLTRAAIQAMDA